MADRIKISVEEDGQIRIETVGVSGANHCSADELLAEIEKLAGGVRDITKLRKEHVHVVSGQIIKHRH